MVEFKRGVRIGVDVGQVRVGVSRSDPDGILATPLVTLARDLTAAPDAVPSDLAELAALVAEHEAVVVVVGLPVNLAGKHGPAAVHVKAYADRLVDVIAPVPVTLTDERMSTVVASRRLAERGVRGKRQRAVVDQAAAVEILQSWLDAQRRRT
ncbi:Holliday junction resolvase RuvX [Micromonospora zamorensis]|uniref:Putative pre-16S rRNA nuclease n=1 Tax=Micromonospora zamorensis TaxID=709883 RepID=A0ABZ1PNB3_9ACTN|nr:MULTISPECIES: Holliday junction resolvase RuvX [Micromonospora]MBQ0980258.1 Holliday junction resolvase RuvX [Micromonospora sp. M61]MBQ1037656.1 Holliday junction resolvase RuvX [Micromonospora sp. C81]TQJ21797.1 putative Holliday junction resolvase [Micromonospora sp. A202]WSK47894.1 Holliday junction resolvase RuvX [Micromonospora zamorensis]WTE89398.1 Holliday junction resolvase RuvX [Micromonospora zamorensis]